MAFDNTKTPKPRIRAARASRPHCDPLEPRRLLASISGIIFEDNNGDGIRGGSDFAMTLKYVYLDTNNNAQPDSAETGTYSQPSGYSFTNLAAGTYNVRVVVPLQYRQSAPANDAAQVVTVAAADTATGKDIGLTTTLPVSGSVQGIVFNDGDANGIRDGADQPLPSTKVFADINGNGALDAGEPYVTPDIGGSYKLRAPPGTYNVRAEFPQDYIGSAPAAGFYPYTFKVGLTALNLNFGAYGFGRVPGSVFDDRDGNGFKSAAEPQLAGRTMYADVNLNGAFDQGEPRPSRPPPEPSRSHCDQGPTPSARWSPPDGSRPLPRAIPSSRSLATPARSRRLGARTWSSRTQSPARAARTMYLNAAQLP